MLEGVEEVVEVQQVVLRKVVVEEEVARTGLEEQEFVTVGEEVVPWVAERSAREVAPWEAWTPAAVGRLVAAKLVVVGPWEVATTEAKGVAVRRGAWALRWVASILPS